VTKLEIAGKRQRGGRPSECHRLEDGVGNRASRKHITCDQFVQNLQRDGLIGDSLDHRERDDEDGSKCNSDKRSPNGKLSRMNLDGDECEYQGDEADNEIPELRDLRIYLHHPRMHVALVLESKLEAADNVLS